MTTPKTLHLFKDYKFVRTITSDDPPHMVGSLCKFQVSDSDHTLRIFTVLSIEDGYAFSQKYCKTQPGYGWHGIMWKHVAGIKVDGDTSFDELVALIP